MSDDAPRRPLVRHIIRERDEMLQAIADAAPDAAILVAIQSEQRGDLFVSDTASNKDQVFIGQVIAHDAMRNAFGEE